MRWFGRKRNKLCVRTKQRPSYRAYASKVSNLSFKFSQHLSTHCRCGERRHLFYESIVDALTYLEASLIALIVYNGKWNQSSIIELEQFTMRVSLPVLIPTLPYTTKWPPKWCRKIQRFPYSLAFALLSNGKHFRFN